MALAAAPDIDVVVELIGGSDGVARRLVADRAALGQACRHRQQGAARAPWHGARSPGREEGPHPRLRGGGGGRHPDHQGAARGPGRQPGRAASTASSTAPATTSSPRCARPAATSTTCWPRRRRLGYAEADPSFDVDGIDAAHKLAILTGARVRPPGQFRRRAHRGHPPRHRRWTSQFAEELGYRIKLLGLARADRDTASSSACIPAWCRSPRRSPTSRACSTPSSSRATSSARTMFEGRGAGAGADRLGRRRRPGRRRARARTCRPSSCRRRGSPTRRPRRWTATSAPTTCA